MNTNDILDWVMKHPDRDGQSWEGFSASLAYQMGLSKTPWPTVLDAIQQMENIAREPRFAPVGAIHLFANPPWGHLAIDLDGGGQRVLTTGTAFDRVLGKGIGIRHLSAMRANLRYVGWVSDLTRGK